MDLTVYFFVAIIMALATWFASRMWGKQFEKTITTIASLAVIVPLLVIFISGALGMLYGDPNNVQEVANSTIEKVVDYVAEKLPYIIISDFAGIFAGIVVGIFTRRDN